MTIPGTLSGTPIWTLKSVDEEIYLSKNTKTCTFEQFFKSDPHEFSSILFISPYVFSLEFPFYI